MIQKLILLLSFSISCLSSYGSIKSVEFNEFNPTSDFIVSEISSNKGSVQTIQGFAKSKGNSPHVGLRIIPKNKIVVNNLGLEIRYKFKVTSTEDIIANFVQIDLSGEDSTVGAFFRPEIAPANDQWLEGKVLLQDAREMRHKAMIQSGYSIEIIDIVARNTAGKEIALIVEYIEVIHNEEIPEIEGLVKSSYEQSGVYDGKIKIDFRKDASVRPYNQEQAGVKDEIAIASSNSRFIGMNIEPIKKIPVDNINRLVKIRLKLVDETESANPYNINSYINFRVIGEKGEAGKSAIIARSPGNGVWYDCEFFLAKSSIMNGKRDFKEGDFIESFMIAARNTSGKQLSLHVDSIEVFETEAPSWSVPTQGAEEIAAVNARLAAAMPGETVILKNGTYANAVINFRNDGTEGKPITLKAETPGKVIVTGVSSLTVDGEYLTVNGLFFKDGFASPRVIYYTPNCKHSRLTNTAIINYNDDGNLKTDIRWVVIRGSDVTVDNCYFKNKTAFGVLLEGAGERFIFENNYFGYFESDTTNGRETLRILSSDDTGKQAHQRYACDSIIRNNFFDRCDGENELISVKGNGNLIQNNTMHDSLGSVTLRYGLDNVVEGNLFIGGRDTARPTGIRLIGYNQTIRHNYFYNSPGSSAPLVIESGSPDDADFMIYYAVKNAEVYRNSFINFNTAILFDAYLGSADYRQQRGEGKISRNLFYSEIGPNSIFAETNGQNRFLFADNIAFGKPLGLNPAPVGITVKNLNITTEDGALWFPENGDYGASRKEIAKAPTGPSEAFSQDNWIKKEILKEADQDFSLNNFTFDPLPENL